MTTAHDWFEALGKPVHPSQRQAALDLLTDEGYNPGEAELVLAVVAREIEHDNPEAAIKYMRSFVGHSETLVIRALATLGCATADTHRDALLDLLATLEPDAT